MPYPSFTTNLEHAIDPLVIALDVGSTASRGAVYDAAGRPVGKRAKVFHQFTTEADGTSTINAGQVVAELIKLIDQLTDRMDLAGRVAGVAIDTFASSLVGVNAAGDAVTPCITYADSRCAQDVNHLREQFVEAEVQQRTGTRLHTSYLAPRLRWFNREYPDVASQVTRWMALGEYFHWRVLGTTAIGTSSAAWTGLLDRRAAKWDAELLEAAGVREEQLGEIRHPSQPLTPKSDFVAKRWPELADAKWFPVVPDGLAANLGTGAFDATKMVASAATSGAMRVVVRDVPETIPSGLWCYRVDEERSILGGALNDVGRAVTWVKDTYRLGHFGEPGEDADIVLDEALRAAPDPLTPMVLPFLTGERSTGWAASARAVFTGVLASATPPVLARAMVEGVALSYRRVADQLSEVAPNVKELRVSGRVPAEVPGLLVVLADVLNVPILPVPIKRSTLHGTALLALEVLAPGVERAEVDLGDLHEPVAAHVGYYEDRLREFERIYRLMVD